MNKRIVSLFLLTVYSAILIRLMVFKVVPIIRSGQVTINFGGVNGGNPPNVIPLATILPYLLGEHGFMFAFLNLAGNIVLLIPVGFLMPLVYRSITWKKAFALGAASGLAIEFMQVLLRVGIFDIDDVILNALGVMIGYWVFRVLTKWIDEKKYLSIILSVIIVIVTSSVLLYAMYPRGDQTVSPRAGGDGSSENMESVEGEAPSTGDLCGGTGGNGQIVSIGTNSFTLKYKEGRMQTIKLTEKIEIHTLKGTGSLSDLRSGNSVTLVGGPNSDGSFSADAVFLCSTADTKTQSME